MSIYEKVLDIWTDHCDGMWYKEDNQIIVSFPGESYTYDSIEEAAEDGIYNIGEYIKLAEEQ
jgi:hypothetical protein